MTSPGRPTAEAAHDILRPRQASLDVFFRPGRVAVIGATETAGSVGRTIVENLIRTPFGGTVFPVNPRRRGVLGILAYPSIAAVPGPVDLAVIVTPAPTVPGIIGECVAAGVRGAIIISAGFKEIGPAGVELERQIMEEARRGRMRVIGPNCLGVMSPLTGLNATFAGAMARPGNVGFISQSGALCTAILDWSLRELVGFSAFLSIGSMLDVGWADLIDYLGNDPRTDSIVIYMETIGDARAFMSAAREVALTKPIIIIKAGRSEAAARAAASHTGALAGSDAVLDAALHRCGVLRVDRIADLFSMAEVLGRQPRPRGPRLTIVTNAGGPGVLATDALVANGGALAELSPATRAALDGLLPPHWSHNNPIDVLGDAGPERYARAVEVAANDPNSDGLLVVLTPQAMTDPTATAAELKAHANLNGKPILASWMGGADVAAGESILNQAGIPTFTYPDTAARAFCYMWRFSQDLRGLYETPVLAATGDGLPDTALATRLIEGARGGGRTLLTEIESKQVLAAYGIPTVPTRLAVDEAAAVAEAEALGYPVVLKLHSETITHKTDVGGVQLNLLDAAAVRRAYQTIRAGVAAAAGPEHFLGVTVQPMMRLSDAYELILGSSLDAQFGPVLLFGAGGQLVEVIGDRALGLPPLTSTLARRLMERTRIFRALQGVRGRPPVDLVALERVLVGFSQLVVEQRWIKEIDINPLLASHEGLLALDARVVLHAPEVDEAAVPRPAIRPYPAQYVERWTMRDGASVVIRPIRPEDEPAMVRFHETLSAESVYFRYFHMLNLSQRVAHERLVRICFNDYDRELALVVTRPEPTTGDAAILAVGRLSKAPGRNEAEFSLLVADPYQGQGIGTELLRRLLQIGRDEGLDRISGEILPDNVGMRRICQQLGFQLRHDVEQGIVEASITL